MQKVVHASLHGNAYAIEETGYQALAHDLPGAWEKVRASWQASR